MGMVYEKSYYHPYGIYDKQGFPERDETEREKGGKYISTALAACQDPHVYHTHSTRPSPTCL